MRVIDQLLAELRALRVEIRVDGDQLRLRAPKGTLTPGLTAEVQERKAEILDYLRRAAENTASPDHQPIPPSPADEPLRLSFSQQRLWFLDQLEGRSPAYNMPLSARLEGPLDQPALRRALDEIVRRHAVLRSNYVATAEEPQVVIREHARCPFVFRDSPPGPGAARQSHEQRLMREEAERSFDLENDVLIRASLHRISDTSHVLFVTMHHIVSDGWSLGVFSRELSALYEAYVAGRPSPLAELPIQYADYAHWQRQWLSAGVLQRQLDFWRHTLRGAPAVMSLPLDHPRPAVQTYRGRGHAFVIDAELSRRLQACCREGDATLFMALLAGFAAVLSRYSGQTDLSVGTAVANRRPETESLIGLFVNTLVLRVDLSCEPSVREMIGRVKNTCLAAYDHQDVPFEQVVDALKPARDLSHAPLFQVSFDMQDDAADGVRMHGLTLMPMDQEAVSSKFDLSLSIGQSGDTLSCVLLYNADLFDAATVARLATHYVELLRDLAARPDARVSRLRLMDDAARQRVLVHWNPVPREWPDARTLPELVDEQAAADPQKIAVTAGDQSLTYGELVTRANRLARYLRGCGVTPESRVALVLDRSVDLLVGLLGIMKAGGAYVPIDPSYPRSRIASMLDAAGPVAIVTQQSLAADLPAGRALVVAIDAAAAEIDRLAGEPLADQPVADGLAYVIYTSGSTGQPKGVQISHRALVNFLWSMRDEPGLSAADTVLALTTISFDIAALELYLPLIVGARVVIADRATAGDPQALGRAIEDHGATFVQATPATWRMLMDAGWQPKTPIRIACGGEALPAELARRLRGQGHELWNLYGPTETTVWSAVRRVGGAPPTDVEELPGGFDPIGRPIANTQLYVLDEQFSPQPIGVPGELYIGGEGLARGYLNQPDLTADRYRPDPWSRQRGARLYRTGDLVRRLSSGDIEFIGRVDNQVKIRGFRIELGEIEAALSRHEAVGQAVVVARPDHLGDKQLVAYIATAGPARPGAEELRAFLKVRLPEFMIPATVVFLEALPHTANGKVDRQALPAVEERRRELHAVYQAPRTSTEQAIAAIWKTALHVDRVGIDDNFFDLGGHSLLMTRVHARLQTAVAARLSLVELFQYPTVRTLAARIAPAPATVVPRPTRAGSPEGTDIAIIGLAGRFPGADDLAAFWRNLRDGRESITFFTDEELLAAGVEPELIADPNYVRANGILSDVTHFDASFFGISPAEAEVMDPQHRIFLETTWHALEHAGYGAGVGDDNVGVFAACSHDRYLIFNLLPHLYTQSPLSIYQVLIGNDRDYLATRASYLLNLRGPSVNVQSACSSSLVAVHMACRSIIAGESDMAVAGGVAVKIPQRSGYLYSEGMIVSPDGHCRPFDARANGTTWGSGVGIVLLKRADRAVADGDTIYALIKGSAINNDGSLKVGFTAPGVDGQARVIAAAHAAAGVDPASITAVEAHGTGTPMGDPAEVAALNRAFGPRRDGAPHCALGSVKANIGHLDTAAGIAGLIKTTLALQHRQLPPSIHFETPNRDIAFADSAFFVNDRLRDWESADGPRRAGVSSFGLGGTNAHVILEEAPSAPAALPSRGAQAIVFSARSEVALGEMQANLAAFFAAHPETAIADAAYTQAVGRAPLPYRGAFACRSGADAAAAVVDPRRVHRGVAAATEVVFMFPGQGTQYAGMGSELYRDEPVYRAAIDRCAELLTPDLAIDLREALYPTAAQSGAASLRLGETWLTQPALFATEYALARLWMSWGIQPVAMIGHSIGEYVAACLGGVFDLPAALKLVAARGRLMWQQPEGAMLSVAAAPALLEGRLPAGVSIAAINAPQSCVVSGPTPVIDAYAGQLAATGLACRRLRTSHAFHSAMMDPVATSFAEVLRQFTFARPAIPFISNVTGDWAGDEVTGPAYWVKHLRQAVRFADGISHLAGEGRVLLEVGPGAALTRLARQQATGGRAPTTVTSMSVAREAADLQVMGDADQVADALAQLWVAGCEVDWTAYFAHERRRRVAMPLYPFARERHWVNPPDAGPDRVADTAGSRTKKLPLDQWFYLPTWVPSLSPPTAGRGALDRSAEPWLIFTNGGELGRGLIALVERQGQQVLSLPAEGVTDYDEVVATIARHGIKRIVHLWNAEPAGDSVTMRRWGYDSLIGLSQALSRRPVEAPLQIIVVSDRLHDVFGLGDVSPDTALLMGPALVIPQEHPGLTLRTIDLRTPSPAVLLAEIASGTSDPQVAYRGRTRFVPGFNRIDVTVDAGAPTALRDHGVYLITGGLGNVGLQLAEQLFASAHARIALLARSPFPDPAQWPSWLEQHNHDDATSVRIRRLQALQQRGAEVLVVSGNVSIESEMRAAVDSIRHRFGALHGVFHAAGALAAPSFTCAVSALDEAASATQFLAKVDGLGVLERVVQDQPLDFCLLVSSLAAELGGLGFAAYSAANRYMDAFAATRNGQNGTAWISTNWDAWSFADRAGAAELSMTPLQGAEAFRRVLSRMPPGRVLISTSDLSARFDQWVRRTGWDTPLEVAPKVRPRRPGAGHIVAPTSASERLLVDLWTELFGFASMSVDDDFFDLGGDSLTGVRLMSMIKSAVGKTLSLNVLLKDTTIRSLAAALDAADAGLAAWSPLVPIVTAGSHAPFFCVPGTGGSVVYLRELARALGEHGRPFYGFQAAGLDGRTPPLGSVEELAEANIAALLAFQATGPYFIGGHSFGSWVALAMAHQLKRQGHDVVVVILDAAAPGDRDLSAMAVRSDTQWLVAIATMLRQLSGTTADLNLDLLEGLDWSDKLDRFAQALIDAGVIPPDADRREIRGLVGVYKAQAQMRYRPELPPVPVDLTLVRATETLADFVDGIPVAMKHDDTWGWRDFGRDGVAVEVVPGDHLTMLTKPHCHVVARCINTILSRYEQLAATAATGKHS
ncbi:MAG: amino acid adenylation domain-containing protein [Acidobacteriota bacterium]|nr:amino acid adenylation domain-containing protein [Acidobacteriota bacterium]